MELHLGDIYMERDCVKFLLRSMSMFKGLKTVFLAETVNGVSGGEVFDRRYKIRDEDLLGWVFVDLVSLMFFPPLFQANCCLFYSVQDRNFTIFSVK